jgi:hypothetical protein
MIENAGQQPCLGNNQQTADKSQQTGNIQPAAGNNALLFKPALTLVDGFFPLRTLQVTLLEIGHGNVTTERQ